MFFYATEPSSIIDKIKGTSRDMIKCWSILIGFGYMYEMN